MLGVPCNSLLPYREIAYILWCCLHKLIKDKSISRWKTNSKINTLQYLWERNNQEQAFKDLYDYLMKSNCHQQVNSINKKWKQKGNTSKICIEQSNRKRNTKNCICLVLFFILQYLLWWEKLKFFINQSSIEYWNLWKHPPNILKFSLS